MPPQRPRVSRETRLLLGTVVISLATLWVLARLRYPDRPSSPDPVGPVLAQLTSPSPLDAIADAVSDLESRVAPLLTRVVFTPRAADPALRATVRVALRIHRDHAAVVVPPGDAPLHADPAVLTTSARGGVGIIPLASGEPVPSTSWRRERPPAAHFVIAAEGTRSGVSFLPVFVGAFTPVDGTQWPGLVWRLPASSALADGALIFTDQGLFAGAVVVRAGERTLVPPGTLASIAEELAREKPRVRGVTGIAVQELTPLVAGAVEVSGGVIVTWVAPTGPAAGLLRPLDVIDAVGGRPLATREQWEAQLDELEVGGILALRVRRAGAEPTTVTVTAVAPSGREQPAPLGAVLRSSARTGAEVLRVEAGGAADHAGVRPGDVITAIGSTMAPTSAQVTRAYAEAAPDRPLVVAVTRGTAHVVLALEKTW